MKQLQVVLLLTSTIIVAAHSEVSTNGDEALCEKDRRARDTSVRPPTIDIGPSSMVYREGQNLTLTCEASGPPGIEKYEWRRNGVLLNISRVFNMARPNSSVGTLTIAFAERQLHDGHYQCLVQNAYGTTLSDIAAVFQAFITTPGPIAVRNVTVHEGESLKMHCKQTPYYPNVAYRWSTQLFGSDEIIPMSNRIHMDDRGTLYFTNVLPEDKRDAKIYRCYAHSPMADKMVGTTYYRIVNVGYTIGLMVPTNLMYAPHSTVGLVGKNISLQCIFSGLPTPSILWTKVSGAMPAGRHSIANHGSSLVIRNLVASDAGSYKCTGTSYIYTPTTRTITLMIGEVPYFANENKRLRNQDVLAGRDVTMTCDPIATPPADIGWAINTLPFPNSRPKRVLSCDRRTLTFKDVTHEDMVVVSCNASNVHGYAYSVGYIKVI